METNNIILQQQIRQTYTLKMKQIQRRTKNGDKQYIYIYLYCL